MAYLDGNDVACLPEAHLPYLATGTTAHLTQILEVIDFCLIALGGEQGWRVPGASNPTPAQLCLVLAMQGAE
jgi:hypothetical protein